MDSSHFTVGNSRDLAPFHSYKDSNEHDLYLLLLKRCYIRGGSKRPGVGGLENVLTMRMKDEDEQDEDLSVDDLFFPPRPTSSKSNCSTNKVSDPKQDQRNKEAARKKESRGC